jgi:deoxyribonuclease V
VLSCVDVDYRNNHAIAACVLFEKWTDASSAGELTVRVEPIADYVSGEFYRRELPCILAVVKKVNTPPDAIVIDGYVWLEKQTKKGLGAHLFGALDAKIPVIGVAKTRFKTAEAAEVCRGRSSNPLFVTAIGMELDVAAEHIRSMHGPYRVPTLLKRVDDFCRNWERKPPCSR